MSIQVDRQEHTALLEALQGEAGCRQLAVEFYGRVSNDPLLHRLFPGKSRKCAIDEFTAFLIQFLGGDEAHTQKRWWLSLHESHARFQISPAERAAWLKHMWAALNAMPLAESTRKTFRQFFEQSSAYMVDPTAKASVQPEDAELATRWNEQHVLDAAVDAVAAGRDQEVIAIAPRFIPRPSVFVGLLVRMMQSRRPKLIAFVINAIERDPSLATCYFAGKTLLHFAAGAGCLDVVVPLLRVGLAPDILDHGGHTALYCAANECASETGPRIVKALVQTGADVNASGGVTQATPLHMAARRGHVGIAQALLAYGAEVNARDRKGETPLQRAMNCRRQAMVQLLQAHETRTPA